MTPTLDLDNRHPVPQLQPGDDNPAPGPPAEFTTGHHRLYVISGMFFAGTVAVVLGFSWASTSTTPGPLRTLLACLFVVVAVGFVGTFVAALLGKATGLQILALWRSMRRKVDRIANEHTQQATILAEAVDGVSAIPAEVQTMLQACATRMGEQLDETTATIKQRLAALQQRVDTIEAMQPDAVAERYVRLGETLAEQTTTVTATLERLRVIEERWTAVAAAGDGNGNGNGDGEVGELVPMPNSRAFQLGREVERRRWERHTDGS